MSEAHHASRAPEPQRGAAPEPAKTRVLILDDDRPGRLVCRAYCDLFDHASHAVRSLDEALAALRREPFDVVVMNVHMERWGGMAAMRALRALPQPAGDLPMVALAGVGRADEAQRWRAAGFAAVVGKPVSAAGLHAALTAARAEEPAAGRRSWAASE